MVRDARNTDGLGVFTALSEVAETATDSRMLRPSARLFRAAAWTLYPFLAALYIGTLFAAQPGMGRFGVLEATYLAPTTNSPLAARAGEVAGWVPLGGVGPEQA